MNINKAVGCFIGSAVGDALGSTLEFGPRRSEKKLHTEMTGGGPFKLKPGEYTDDTAMALALGTSLLDHRRFDAFEVAMEFTSWYVRGKYASNGRCFDIGNTTKAALEDFIATKHGLAKADPAALGNGALMRLAPVPIMYWKSPDRAADVASLQARVTHNSAYNADVCGWLAKRLARQITSEASLFHDQPAGDYAPFDSDFHDLAGMKRADVSSSGHVRDTLIAALWSVETTDSFEAAVIRAVNLGDDADTVGAVAGMIAGAIYGHDGIPDRWRRTLVGHDAIKALAQRLTQTMH